MSRGFWKAAVEPPPFRVPAQHAKVLSGEFLGMQRRLPGAGVGAAWNTISDTCSAKPSGCNGLSTPFSYMAATCIPRAPLYGFRGASVVLHRVRKANFAEAILPKLWGRCRVRPLLTLGHCGRMTKIHPRSAILRTSGLDCLSHILKQATFCRNCRGSPISNVSD